MLRQKEDHLTRNIDSFLSSLGLQMDQTHLKRTRDVKSGRVKPTKLVDNKPTTPLSSEGDDFIPRSTAMKELEEFLGKSPYDDFDIY